MKISRIDLAFCALPLPRAIKLGPTRITTRDFVVIRITTDTGQYGDAVGYPRGAALFEEARVLAPNYLGTDPFMRRRSWEHVAQRLVNTQAANLRAMSLFDIALSDIVAKALDVPAGRLLGGYRDRVPVMAVAGYYLNERSIEDVGREVSALFDAGYDRVKIMLSGSDPEFDLAYAKAMTDIAPGRIAADAHWSWTTVSEAYDTCRRLDDLGLVFIEDPFGPTAYPLLARLAETLRTPLAAGEDVPARFGLDAIATAVGRLLVDATTCGGLTAAHAAIEAAGNRGVAVLPHIFPTLHAQLAGALPAIEMIEQIPQATQADPLHELLARDIRVENGICEIDQEPGCGLALDWEAVSHRAVKVDTLER